jgi:hypothetical protein
VTVTQAGLTNGQQVGIPPTMRGDLLCLVNSTLQLTPAAGPGSISVTTTAGEVFALDGRVFSGFQAPSNDYLFALVPPDAVPTFPSPAPGGGSSGPSPSNTVTGPDSFGASPAAGSSALYSRGDHDHGLPAAPAVPSASSTVTGPDSFGASPSAGSAATFSRGDHDHGLPSAPSVPSASSTVTGPDAFGASASAGSASTFSRGDHDHGLPANPQRSPATTVVGPDAFNSPAAVGTSLLYARADHDHGLPANTGGSFPQLFASARVYTIWYDGSKYHATDFSDGTDYTNGANGNTVIATLLNSSGSSSPLSAWIDSSVQLSGQSTVTEGYWALQGLGPAPMETTGAKQPNLGQLTIGASGHTDDLDGIYLANCKMGELDFLNYGSVSDFVGRDLGFLLTGAAGGLGIQFKNVSTADLQYFDFLGSTKVVNGQGASAADQSLCSFTGTGTTSSIEHLYFERITTQGNAGTSATTFNYFQVGNGVKWGRVRVGSMDINTNGAGAYQTYILYFDGGSASTVTGDGLYSFGPIVWESHQGTNGSLAALVGCGSFSAGSIGANVVFDHVQVSGGSGLSIFNNGGGKFTQLGNFLEVRGINCVGSANEVVPGTWAEDTTCPIFVGQVWGQTQNLNSGAKIASPVSSAGGVLSIGTGGGALANTTTYTVGGTPLLAYLTGGTITLETSDGTTIASAVTSVRAPYALPAHSKVSFGTAADATIYKAV